MSTQIESPVAIESKCTRISDQNGSMQPENHLDNPLSSSWTNSAQNGVQDVATATATCNTVGKLPCCIVPSFTDEVLASLGFTSQHRHTEAEAKAPVVYIFHIACCAKLMERCHRWRCNDCNAMCTMIAMQCNSMQMNLIRD